MLSYYCDFHVTMITENTQIIWIISRPSPQCIKIHKDGYFDNTRLGGSKYRSRISLKHNSIYFDNKLSTLSAYFGFHFKMTGANCSILGCNVSRNKVGIAIFNNTFVVETFPAPVRRAA